MAKGRLKAKVKKAISKAKDKAKSVGKKLSYAQLTPFKPVMVAALKKRGVSNVGIGTKMSTLVPLFHDVIIKGKTKLNFEDYAPKLAVTEHMEHVYAEAADAIIGAVLDFIQNLKNKKDSGAPLSKEEEAILEGSEKVADAAVDAGKDAAKNWFADLWYIWVAVIAFLIFLAVRKKK